WLVVAACGSGTPPPENHVRPPPASENRCLAVVAKACGCVYACGVGVRDGDHWNVTHAFWKGSTLRARIEPWCVGGACTDVFAADIVCDGICIPKRAETSCPCPTA